MPRTAALQNIFPPNPSTERSQPSQLAADPKGENIIYCSGSNVVIRNINDPRIVDVYTEHNATTTVARYSPSGFYVVSGDVRGFIRVWDTTSSEHRLKSEFQVLGGAVTDVAWSDDSKKILVVGDGRGVVGKVIQFDTGSSTGEISGHSKKLLSCDFRRVRPFTLATAGEDFQVNFFTGPPFKFKSSNTSHSNFVNCVRYSPDYSKFISVSSDRKGFLYDAATGEKVGELSAEGAHTGSILSCCWSPDGSQIITASADKTLKLWSGSDYTLIKTFHVSAHPVLGDMQQAVLWVGPHIISLSLNGDLLYWDVAADAPIRVVQGHQKSLTAVATDPEQGDGAFFSASYDGVVVAWRDGAGKKLVGAGHTNSVQGLNIQRTAGHLVSAGMDDQIRYCSLDTLQFSDAKVATEGLPASLATGHVRVGLSAAALPQAILLVEDNNTHRTNVDYTPTSVSLSPDDQQLAVGGADNLVRLYTIEGLNLTLAATLAKHRGIVTAVTFSPDGQWIASADANREVILWNRADNQPRNDGWVFHTARVNTLAWAPSSLYVASGSIDRDIIIWSVEAPKQRTVVKDAHKGGVTGLGFTSETTLISVGADNLIKLWSITEQ